MNNHHLAHRSSAWAVMLATAVLPSVVMQAGTQSVPDYASISNQSSQIGASSLAKPLTRKHESRFDKYGLEFPCSFKLGKDFHQTFVYKTMLNVLISEAVLLQCEVGGEGQLKSSEIGPGASLFIPLRSESVPAGSEASISAEGRLKFGQGQFGDFLVMSALYAPSWVVTGGYEGGCYTNTTGITGLNAQAVHVGAYIKPCWGHYGPEVVKLFFNLTNGLTSVSKQEKTSSSFGAYAKAAFSPDKMMNISWFRAMVIEVGVGGQFTQHPSSAPFELKLGLYWLTPAITLCLTRSDLNERARGGFTKGHPWRKQMITPPSYIRCLAERMQEARNARKAEKIGKARKVEQEKAEAEALKFAQKPLADEVLDKADQAEDDLVLLSNAETVGMDKELFRSGLIDVLKDEEEGKGLHAVTHLINVVRSDALKLETFAPEVENYNAVKQVYENIFCSLHYRRLNLDLEKYSKGVWDAEGIESTREAINQLEEQIGILPSQMKQESDALSDMEKKYYPEIQAALSHKYALDVGRFRAKFLPEGLPLSEKVLFEHSYLLAAWRKAIHCQHLELGNNPDFDIEEFKEFKQYLSFFRPNFDVSVPIYLQYVNATTWSDCYDAFVPLIAQLHQGNSLIKAELGVWNAQGAADTKKALDDLQIAPRIQLRYLQRRVNSGLFETEKPYLFGVKAEFIGRVRADIEKFTDKVRLALDYNPDAQ